MTAKREQRLRIFEAGDGRELGWFVEKDGRRIAELTDPQFEDMFWVSYALTPLVDDEVTRTALFTSELWAGAALVFANRVTGEIVPHALAAGGAPKPRS